LKAIVTDFGGVLTTPLAAAIETVQQQTGVEPTTFGEAIGRIAEREGAHPLFELECGRIAEEQFNRAMSQELSALTGQEVDFGSFGELLFQGLHPNDEMIQLMARLGQAGYRMAILTNNVREWESRWKSMLPVEEIFELVVDSAFVNCRKPEPEIYRITLDRLGLAATDCLFIDDMEINCQGAAALGFHTVHFRDNRQAIAEIRSVVGTDAIPDVDIQGL
jgi:putative hydrolase of the HAD superfamily